MPMPSVPFPLFPVLFLVGIFYLNLICRVILAPLLPVLEAELRIGHGEAGFLFLLLMSGYALGLLGSGVAAWQLGHRNVIAVSSIGVGASMLVISRSPSQGGMGVGLVCLGTAAGLYLPSGIATLTTLTEEAHWGKVLALHELAPNLGYVTGPLLAEALLKLLSWHDVLAVLGLAAILLGILFMPFGRGGRQRADLPRFDAIARLLQDPALWVMATLFAASIGAGLGLYSMMPLFLVSEMGMSRAAANTITGLSRVLGMLIIFFAGLITDRTGPKRALVLFVTATGLLTLLLGLIRGPIATPVLVFLQATAAACFFPPAFSMVSTIFPSHVRSLAVSTVVVVGALVGGGAIPAGIGYFAEAFSFSSAFALTGLLTLAAIPPLLRVESSEVAGERAP